ncbi:hypothetical protein KSS87_003202 [Heliosperma pusillum]|nr:hypothetical protein KSS87_003202 [Heliosperma pusillum]
MNKLTKVKEMELERGREGGRGRGKSKWITVSAAVPARCEGCGKFAQTSTEVSLVDLHPTETCSDKMASSVASCQTGSRGQRFTSA